jgi:hypothetical protein
LFAVSESQARPQLPQLFTSVFVLRQTPEQHCSEPPEQVRPHAPQFEIVSRRVQVPPQQPSVAAHARAPEPVPHMHWSPLHVVPAGHDTVQGEPHMPAVHVCPAEQARPHMPQLPALVLVSTHTPPQQLWVPAQEAVMPQRHAPLTQVSPGSHAGEQLPPPVSMGTGPVSRATPVSRAPPPSTEPVSSVGPTSRPPPPLSGTVGKNASMAGPVSVPGRPASRPPPPLAQATRDPTSTERSPAESKRMRTSNGRRRGRPGRGFRVRWAG